MTLIILRPEPGASATFDRASALGLLARKCPLFILRALEWETPDLDGFDALMITSANVIHFAAGLDQLKCLPVIAVGTATADAARNAGFDIRLAADGGAQELIDAAEKIGLKRLLRLAGKSMTPVVTSSINIITLIVYADEACAVQLPMNRPCVFMVHSGRAASRLCDVIGEQRARHHIIAISAPVGQSCGDGWASVSLAKMPNDAAMLELAHKLCHRLAND